MAENEMLIRDILEGAFKRVSGAKDNEKSHLIFPHYRSGAVRVSEQELRFAFVEELRTVAPQWYYAVEVPTAEKYYFKGGHLQIVSDGGVACYIVNGKKTNAPIVDENGKESKGQSGNFDLVVYEDKEGKMPIALIEFKGKNPEPNDYLKDYLKLENHKEGDCKVLRFFVQLLEASDIDTYPSIKCKIGEHLEKQKVEDDQKVFVNYICYSLAQRDEKGDKKNKPGNVTDKILNAKEKYCCPIKMGLIGQIAG